MTKNKWLLVSGLSTLAFVGIASAQPCGPKGFEKKMDKDGDGVVTTAEFQTGLLERWTSADANKDGKVTADEFKAEHSEHKQERFSERDSNKDGVLARSEVAKMPDQVFTRIDADKSGTLSLAEFESAHPRHGFKGAELNKLPGDANGDGTVTEAEAREGAQKFAQRLDANGDGKLTKDELVAHRFGPHHGFGPHQGAQSDPTAPSTAQ
jgi:hypothetical protein